MNQEQKKSFYRQACAHVTDIVGQLKEYLVRTEARNQHIRVNLPKENEDNKIVQQKLLEHGTERAREIEALLPSPFFVRCVVELDGKDEDMMFGKFSYTDADIYSWITPVSAIRFEPPGPIMFEGTEGTIRKGTLKQKDQYRIANGSIQYLSTESLSQERELVYQEYFSHQSREFALPEIVALMEKAQDDVIRASHKGPFIISGPAGSGKTTLALHRVAYLAQSPDVADLFPPHKMLVFVQDEGTQIYFKQLLPKLGITGVTIMTYAQWAMMALDLDGYTYAYRFGKNEMEKDLYEVAKIQALRKKQHVSFQKNPFDVLENAYADLPNWVHLTFKKQEAARVLDRIDLTILLQSYKATHGNLDITKEVYRLAKQGAATKTTGRFPAQYSLIIFDEFQNYLPEQLQLACTTVDPELQASMFIGDMAQQTMFGTITSWEDLGFPIPEERKVTLQKVYRNTKEIIEFIRSIGYDIEVSDQLRAGKAVQEKECQYIEEQVTFVQALASENSQSLGILAKDAEALIPFQKSNLGNHVHCMTMHEAQGVEFERVCIVGITDEAFSIPYAATHPQEAHEKERMNKDLLYVALTRAMNELYVIGTTTLKQVLQK